MTSNQRTAADVLMGLGITPDEEALEHYGVRGMKWGKRKKRTSVSVSIADGRTSITRTLDGPGSVGVSVGKKVRDLTDEELSTAIKRIKLEREFAQLTTPAPSKGKKMVQDFLAEQAKQQAKSALEKGMASGGKKIEQLLLEGSGKHRK